VTRTLSEFVHGYMSMPVYIGTPELVSQACTGRQARMTSVNSCGDLGFWPVLVNCGDMRAGAYWLFADALPGCGTEMNWLASRTPVPTGVGIEIR
jgi:hypothetical protein